MLSGYRNDLYFVIERGDFERGGKSSSKNVEVTVLVLDEFGRPIQVKNLFVSQARNSLGVLWQNDINR